MLASLGFLKEEPVNSVARRLLCLVADEPTFKGCSEQFVKRVVYAVRGGLTHVQYRNLEADFDRAVWMARQLKSLLPNHITFSINVKEVVGVAEAVQPKAVFLESPESFEHLRMRCPAVEIGVPAQFDEALEADLWSVKVWRSTETNKSDSVLFGLEGLHETVLRAPIAVPILAIGGIDAMNSGAVWRQLRPQDGIAVAGVMREGYPPAMLHAIWSSRRAT